MVSGSGSRTEEEGRQTHRWKLTQKGAQHNRYTPLSNEMKTCTHTRVFKTTPNSSKAKRRTRRPLGRFPWNSSTARARPPKIPTLRWIATPATAPKLKSKNSQTKLATKLCDRFCSDSFFETNSGGGFTSCTYNNNRHGLTTQRKLLFWDSNENILKIYNSDAYTNNFHFELYGNYGIK